MGKKKTAHNDFYFFMQDQKNVLKRENYVWNSMDELVEICSRRWKDVPEEDKKRYKEKAKNHKRQQQLDLTQKFTSTGDSLAELQKKQSQNEEKVKAMHKEINDTVSNAIKTNTLDTMKFYLVHINDLVEVDEEDFLPCEMAIVEFTIKSGITKVFHTFVRPQRVPIGLGYKIQTNVNERHALDPDSSPLTDMGRSWSAIVRKMYHFIAKPYSDGSLPPLYTLEELNQRTDQMLDKIHLWGGEFKRPDLRIFNVHELFGHMAHYTEIFGPLPPPLASLSAAGKLKSDEHDLAIGIACDYHDFKERAQHCSLTKVKSWAYIICQFCCQHFDVLELTEGRHIPYQSFESSKTRRNAHDVFLSRWEPGELGQHDRPVINWLEDEVPKTKAAAAGIISEADPSASTNRPVWDDHSYNPVFSGNRNVSGPRPGTSSGSAWSPLPSQEFSNDEFPALGAAVPKGPKPLRRPGTTKMAWEMANMNLK